MPADISYSPSIKTGLVKTPSRLNSTVSKTTPKLNGSQQLSSPQKQQQTFRSFPIAAEMTEGQSQADTPNRVTSPTSKRRATMESEHQGELLKRQDIHMTLLAATEGRRDRAHAILDLHRGEISSLENLIRQAESDTIQLDDLRKELAEAIRRQEVVAFRSTKDVKLMMQKEQQLQRAREYHRTGFGAGNGIASTYLSAALGQYTISATSPMRTLFGPTLLGSQGLSLSNAVSGTTTTEWDILTERLVEARRVGDELEKECLENERLLSARTKERSAIKDLIIVAEEHLKELEAEAPATLDKLVAAKARIKTATEHAHLLPDLRRMVEDNATALHLQKKSSGETTRALMELIKEDDGKLLQLRTLHGGSSSATLSALSDFGSHTSTTVVGKIASDVEMENELYTTQLQKLVVSAEEQRAQLQATSEMLASRVRYLEDRAARTLSIKR